MDLFELNGRVVINLADAVKAFNELQNEGQKTESKLSKFFSGIGKGAVAVGKTVATGLAAGGAAMGALTMKALSATGELEQNMGGSEAVFKEYAASMQETAKNAFSTMGLATSDYLATANKMGSLFKGAGFEASEAADITTKAMQRAADVASIMGISTESAMESIAGAAKGNFTMMDNLGVAMNDTTLQAYALSKGIDKSTQEMTNQEKIGLAMEMFLEKTADYAGNYTKENETLAGSLGTAKAALSNFLDGSGDVDQLVTAFTGAAHSIIGTLQTLAPRLVSGISEIISQLTPQLPSLLQELLPAITEGAIGLVTSLAGVLPQVVPILTDSVIPALIESIIPIATALIDALPSLVETICNALPTLLPLLIDAMVQLAVLIASNLGSVIEPILQALPEIASSMVMGLTGSFSELDTGMQMLAIAVGVVTAAIAANTLANKLKAIAVAAGTAAEGSATIAMGLHTVASNIATAATTAFGAAMSFLTSPITLVILAIGALIAIVVLCVKHWDDIKEAGAKAWEWIKNAWSKAGEWFSNLKDKIVSAFSNIFEKLTAPFNKARDKIKEVADKIKGFFKGEISMPKIKVPKFSITPSGWKIGDLLDGVIPKLSIKWNAKGAIMKEPTIFGYNPATGTLQGGGEAGDEAVAPIDTLQQYVKAAVQSENTVMVTKLDRIIDLLVRFFPEMLGALDINMYLDTGVLVAETASQYDVALGKIAIKKGRGR